MNNPLTQYIDLLFLANTSALIMDDRNCGYYLHGRNQLHHTGDQGDDVLSYDLTRWVIALHMRLNYNTVVESVCQNKLHHADDIHHANATGPRPSAVTAKCKLIHRYRNSGSTCHPGMLAVADSSAHQSGSSGTRATARPACKSLGPPIPHQCTK